MWRAWVYWGLVGYSFYSVVVIHLLLLVDSQWARVLLRYLLVWAVVSILKTADVGSDLVGKVEAGIPEDDPRNPGVIADNVGDCVGDTAGLGADIFESYCGSMIAAIVIGASMATLRFEYMALPIMIAMVGLIASVIGIRAMTMLGSMDPSAALRNCTFISAGAMLFVAFFLIKVMGLPSGVFIALLFGCLAGIGIGLITEYYTASKPVVRIAESSKNGGCDGNDHRSCSGYGKLL